MSGYDFLVGTLVLEYAQLGPAALGGYLCDMGATVIKVEQPGSGDPARYSGAYAIGTDDGIGYLHTRWNRGKRSIAIDLRRQSGLDLFKRLASKADIVIDGMRAGALSRLGLGYDVLSVLNDRVVFCSLSGFGTAGPYSPLPSLGPSFDGYAGLSAPGDGAPVSQWARQSAPAIGMYAMGWAAAVGVLAALVRARTSGRGAMIEVAGADVAAAWQPEGIDAALNPDTTRPRSGFADASGRPCKWPRLDVYRASDGLLVLVQLYGDAAWRRFVTLLDQPNLDCLYAEPPRADEDDRAAPILADLFASRPRAAWIALALEHGLPITPVNTGKQLVDDPHFQNRRSVYEAHYPGTGRLALLGSPIRTPDQPFTPAPAPVLGQHTDRILTDLLSLDAEDIRSLRAAAIIA